MGLLDTPEVDRLRSEGLLVHDKRTNRWIDLREHDEDALQCQHVYLAFDGKQKTCQRCGCEAETAIVPEDLPSEGEMLVDSIKGVFRR